MPPDHFYCREHSVGVDDRLHEIGDLIGRIGDDVPRLAQLLDHVAQETWDYLAEARPDEPDWPPPVVLGMRAHPDDVDVDVDTEPGQVRVEVRLPLAVLLDAVASALGSPDVRDLGAAAAAAEGANATH